MNSSNTPPLVSVRILTYNSSKYIEETLDSVYLQTYKNIELIVSDDCSKDDTVRIVSEWIEKHQGRFTRVVFLTSPVNTGVCANSKRSLEAVTGDWIKGLGGDDCLYPYAIEEYVRFVQNENCEICASLMDYMDEEGNKLDVQLGSAYDSYLDNLRQPYKKQLYLVKQGIIVPGPVLFYSRKLYEKTGGPDERFGTADEWSFLYKILKCGFKIYLLEKNLIRYRVHNASLTRKTKWNNNHPSVVSNRRFMKDVLLKDMLHKGEFLQWWHLYIKYLKWGNLKMRYLRFIDPLWYCERFNNKKKS